VDLRTLELKIKRSENLPVLPEVVRAVFRTADDASSSSRALEKLILYDPALTAKVIRVANSPMYGTARVPTVGRALAVLGLSKARSLLISLVLQQLVVGRQESRRFNQHDYWSHSIAVGSAARLIASYSSPLLTDALYCAGIMHDIGILVMDKFCPEVIDAVIAAAEMSRKPLHEAEPDVASFGHADVAKLLALHWGMDDMTTQAIGFHHKPNAAGPFELEAKILNAADSLAHMAGYTNQAPLCTSYELTAEQLQAVGVPIEELESLKERLTNEVADVTRSFESTKVA
jgi:HD-like signal output (HDOD) protein